MCGAWGGGRCVVGWGKNRGNRIIMFIFCIFGNILSFFKVCNPKAMHSSMLVFLIFNIIDIYITVTSLFPFLKYVYNINIYILHGGVAVVVYVYGLLYVRVIQ